MKTRIMLVGGFLGAGKTTLLAQAARTAAERGLRVGLVTNDQAAGLVDTAILSRAVPATAEVSGSCFCCAFDAFVAAVEKLREEEPLDLVIAEPVGSCTDLSATLLQPLKAYYRNAFEAAPLSALADPARLDSLLSDGDAGLGADAAYIMAKQLEEADTILIGKADLLDAEAAEGLAARVRERWPAAEVRAVSPRTGAGVGEWLDRALARADGGRRLAVVDYDRYARGEAALGWLNATYAISGAGRNWNGFVRDLMEGLRGRFEKRKAGIGHVKVFAEAEGEVLAANLTGGAEGLSLRGALGPAERIALTLNARAELPPEELERIAAEEMRRACDAGCGAAAACETKELRCLSPGRPNPTYRFTFVAPPG